MDGWMDGWGCVCVRCVSGCVSVRGTQLIQGVRNERCQETPKIAGAVALLAKQVERGLSGLLFVRVAQHAPRRVASLKASREEPGPSRDKRSTRIRKRMEMTTKCALH